MLEHHAHAAPYPHTSIRRMFSENRAGSRPPSVIPEYFVHAVEHCSQKSRFPHPDDPINAVDTPIEDLHRDPVQRLKMAVVEVEVPYDELGRGVPRLFVRSCA